MLDAIIAGAGPAGSVAGLVLARAGARVLIVDRDPFPRDKFCGDTLNPGAVRLLAGLGLSDAIGDARPLGGMRLTSLRASVVTRYSPEEPGVSILRRDLDARLLQAAIQAGAKFESGLSVRAPLVEHMSGGDVVRGLVVAKKGSDSPIRLPASLTIAADGRRSRLAAALNLTKPTSGPRRWAYGTYVGGVTGMSDLGEMHIRPWGYVGIAPITETVANVCVVKGIDRARVEQASEGRSQTPLELITMALAGDADLAPRFVDAEFDPRVRVVGPLAVSVRAPGAAGLLLCGDAAGFVDPMTGDGLSLAMRGAVLAAHEALATLETGDVRGAVGRLALARRRAFGAKLRFNRVVRRLVESPRAIDAASIGATWMPALVRRTVQYAGEVR